MLKTVSSVVNALGALNYKGTWNADTNTPTLASGVGTQGDYYVVSVAGTTNLDGITNWGPGDWAAFNGSVWQRVEGGADGNFVNLDVTGTASFADGSLVSPSIVATSDGNTGFAWLAPGELSLIEDGNERVKVSGDGIDVTGGVTLTTSLALPDGTNSNPSLRNTGDSNTGIYFPASDNCAITTGGVQRLLANSSGVKLPDGNLIIGTSGKGIDFSATAGTGTSELLSDYEEGTWTPAVTTGTVTGSGNYTKIGDLVTVRGILSSFSDRTTVANIIVEDLPFASTLFQAGGSAFGRYVSLPASTVTVGSTSKINFYEMASGNYGILQHSNLTSSSSAVYFEATYLSS